MSFVCVRARGDLLPAKDGLTGSAWGDWANYTASPLRAFENELGVQDPVGFWDPAGFTADGSVEDFKRRRQTEIKHGRIAMLAAMGYITPEQLICRKLFCLKGLPMVSRRDLSANALNPKPSPDQPKILPPTPHAKHTLNPKPYGP